MKARRMRNAEKRVLIYFSVVFLYIVIFSNILSQDNSKRDRHLGSGPAVSVTN